MQSFREQIATIMPAGLTGTVVRTEGVTTAVSDFPAPVGSVVEIERQTGVPVLGEVIGFRDRLTLVYPFQEVRGVRRGNRVKMLRTSHYLRVGGSLLGRVVNFQGELVDEGPPLRLADRTPLSRRPPPAVQRPRIDTPFTTGVRAIDSVLTCGVGQRMGIFAGSGVGKSVLMGMLAKFGNSDVNVIGLIGERGREVNDFLERDLGPQGLAKSVVVVATSDEPALARVQAAMAATAIAEYFRDAGKNVLLMMDSLTRFAMAQREIGLAAGEPPTTRGYPPSVFALLPKLVERAGRSKQGSITGFYTVLVEGDDTNEPVSDTVRGLLDGHTILSRSLASKSHYPAIDVLESISRTMPDVIEPAHLNAASVLRQILAAYRDHEDLISIGAYRQGANPIVDAAIALKPAIDAFLKQTPVEHSTAEQTQALLTQLTTQAQGLLQQAVAQPAAEK